MINELINSCMETNYSAEHLVDLDKSFNFLFDSFRYRRTFTSKANNILIFLMINHFDSTGLE